ncbi:penicillin-binding protein [Saccharopolyspora sp. HNM0983]|uniref:Penicillin-binding protein n=1 Tax=Saccharopolyspora montiporae TaxID=2781240 RepID=A0A929B9L2_9PSEU|nr:penicillin-binding transpeptidase domain-containing protein [Saccharopolyspora sp. HNM0983]MBE9374350.1 penicillin-binding protein [Saccharopolyspora sp. HNM0983]
MRLVRIFGGAAALLLLPVAACSSGPSEDEVAGAFLNAVAAGDAAEAARLTDDPAAARSALEAVHRGLDPESAAAQIQEVTEDEQGAPVARFDWTWNFGPGKEWRYPSGLRLVEGEQGPEVHWSPSVVHPDLRRGQVPVFAEQPPQPPPVLDRDGNELMQPAELVTVSLQPAEAGDLDAVAGQLGDALSGVDPAINRESILEGARQAPPGQPYTAVTLRPDDYAQVQEDIQDLPGVRLGGNTRLIAPERGFGDQVLSGVASRVDEQVQRNAGWRVYVAGRDGAEVEQLHQVAQRPVPPTQVTLSEQAQQAAEDALDPVETPAMLVAVRPSTGGLVAVAQNDPADAQGPVALTGQYPPGSTFKIATAAAALQSGRVDAGTPVECPPRKEFDGRVLPNADEFDLGTVPLHTAFAESCNTSFAQLAVDMPAGDLTRAAGQLGIGADFEMPGATTITGQAPEADTTVQRAENGIGQGEVLASPFGMALATAAVAEGRMPVPSLIRGEHTGTQPPPEPLPGPVLDQLRSMMREVVTSGTGSVLSGSGEVVGKTGTAQFGDGTRAHGWFAGYREDVAFAVLTTDSEESAPALQAAQRFLEGT